MIIPEDLKDKYTTNHNISALIEKAVGRIEQHIKSVQKMCFFPEYTDHSITHLEDVLQTSWNLATKESRDKLSDKDCAALIVGVCLHDFGMWITYEGFLSLIHENSIWKGIDGLDTKSWRDLWIEFLKNAKKFDNEKLENLFGTTNIVVREPPEDKSIATDNDKLLIGEFIRLHHARLGHEIAIYGIPGNNGNSIKLFDETDDIATIGGLIARSHWMDLRACADYLKAHFHSRATPRNIKAIFIMALLRISDFVQIQEERAPQAVMEVQKFESPFSEGEWKVHHSIKAIIQDEDDEEAIFFESRPRDIHTYLKVRNWQLGFQNELDKTWSVIGEVFSQKRNLKTLRLEIRRIKSNLDNMPQFADSVDYVPEKMSFDVKNSETLGLLVGPLYGNDPFVGIRELTQNAVDAVREFDVLKEAKQISDVIKRNDIPCDVQIEFVLDDEGNPTQLIITDKGVGMDLQVIRDYFLKAGATYRNSSNWKSAFEDEEGKFSVPRTGRFGIGVLAAFLIGDEIEVITRHYSSPNNGFNFNARINQREIEIKKGKAKVGTTIKISINSEHANRLKRLIEEFKVSKSFAGLFWHNYPDVKIKLGEEIYSTCNDFIPEYPYEGKNWRNVENDHYKCGINCYDLFLPNYIVNGFAIQGERLNPFEYMHAPKSEPIPVISLTETSELVPLTLTRRKVINPIGIEEEISITAIDEMIAFYLINGIHTDLRFPLIEGSRATYDENLDEQCDQNLLNKLKSFCISNHGFAISNPILAHEANYERMIRKVGLDHLRVEDIVNFEHHPRSILFSTSARPWFIDTFSLEFLSFFVGRQEEFENKYDFLFGQYIENSGMSERDKEKEKRGREFRRVEQYSDFPSGYTVKSQYYKEIVKNGEARFSAYDKKRKLKLDAFKETSFDFYEKSFEDGKLKSIEFRTSLDKNNFISSNLANEPKDAIFELILEREDEFRFESGHTSALTEYEKLVAKRWLAVLGQVFIPYSDEARTRLIQHARKYIGYNIDRILSEKE